MPETKEWTLMFYFASDNPLAPGIVSQLKAIKDAGHHPEANVIARFDPHPENAPAHIFEVNRISKLKANGVPQIGFDSDDPFIRSLVLDKLWEKPEINNRIQASLHSTRNGRLRPGRRPGRERPVANENVQIIPFKPPIPTPEMSGEQMPLEALSTFLDFCVENYPAHHYMLFILGHGVIVGNDLFLFDEHANDAAQDRTPHKRNGNGRATDEESPSKNSLLLKDLGGVLRRFKKSIGRSTFELIGFHSCSMSGLEVAYEIQGTANYMLASQGPNFVGSWPYKQILIRIFKDLEDGVRIDKETFKKIFYYCLYNNHDFQLAGYSFDMTLCDLKKVKRIEAPLRALSRELSSALAESASDRADPLAKEFILLAHWDAQSYYQESYTDLYDFCFRLHYRCEHAFPASAKTGHTLKALKQACVDIMDVLKRGVRGDDDGLIVRCEFAGPAFQYSHGLSVFFPWSEPINGFFSKEYKNYKFKKTNWSKFLHEYFTRTMRAPHAEERDRNERPAKGRKHRNLEASLLEEITTRIFRADGQLDRAATEGMLGGPDDKGGGSDPTGGCDCPSIKNYPSSTRARPISPNFFAEIDG